MCGILGYYRPEGLDRESVQRSINALRKMAHRGPDGEGMLLIDTRSGTMERLRTDETSEGIACDTTLNEMEEGKADLLLGHRRLSIFDTSLRGHQPMIGFEGGALVHNGEVYNFPEIREALKEKGYRFKTGTDTEVILASYQEHGPSALEDYVGMWSFLLWDPLKGQLFVSNDRYGIKPLYYAAEGGTFMFASEVKAFQEFPALRKGLDQEAIYEFLEYNRIDHDQRTFFQGVHRFPPSTYWELSMKAPEKAPSPVPYWKVPEQVGSGGKKEEDLVEGFNELFQKAVALRMRADVPYGVSLSGGLDSSGIIYTMDRLLKDEGGSKGVDSFGAIFPDLEGDESEHIHYIENDLGLKGNHTEPYKEFDMEDLKKMIQHQDAPILSTSFYAQWCVMRAASRAGYKVLIGGQGADELFAGYHHHFYRHARRLLLKGRIGKYMDEVRKFCSRKGFRAGWIHRLVIGEIKVKLMSLFGTSRGGEKEWVSWDFDRMLEKDLRAYQLPYFLRSDDRTSMAFGVETRLPFLDHRLVEFAMALPPAYKIRDGWQKWILRRAFEHIPDPIRWRKDKKGFTTPQDSLIEENRSALEPYLEKAASFGPPNASIGKGNGKLNRKDFKGISLGIWLEMMGADQ
ncbi:MAG: asparagine synthase (glutamine-hydrolyzing) [Flavobacteriales bacterium]